MRVSLLTIAREWGRIGCIGFGGPPAHISLLRALCVQRRGWIAADEFEDAVAAVNLLPGPASTQLAIYCAWRLRGVAGALLGGACFICPGLVVILALAALFLSGHPPLWVRGAAAGAGAAVPVVALSAAASLVPASWRRAKGPSALGSRGDAPTSTPVAGAPGGPVAGAEGAPVTATPPRPAAGAPRLPATEPVRLATMRAPQRRWVLWAAAGLAGGVISTPYLVLVLVGTGALETVIRSRPCPGGGEPEPPSRGTAGVAWATGPTSGAVAGRLAARAVAVLAPAGLGALAWVAFKVGALSYGGGFVIIPLMQHDAVVTYHWMTGPQFLDAVALGQVTPGPVVQTVAVVGYAADRLAGGLLASFVAFAPSFVFVLLGGPHLDRLRFNARVQGFFAGAGPAAIGAIGGSAVPLARELTHLWQFGLLAAVAVWLLALRRGTVSAIVGAALIGVAAALAGAAVPT